MLGAAPRDLRRAFRSFNAAAQPFLTASEAHDD
jgi:hypothetical protein